MPADRRVVESGLLNKGFRQSEGDHHYFIYYTLNNRKTTIKTKTSHGMREMDDSLLSQMARQCKLNRGQFIELFKCPLTQEEYERILAEQQLGLT